MFSWILGLLLLIGPAWAGINVNSASSSELEALPGIGPSKASAIIEYRSANGPFTNLTDLDAVPGIGPATLQNISAMVEFGEIGEAAASARAEEPAEATSETTTSAPSTGGVNVNTASASELQSLSGIGPSKAQAIVDDRASNGPYASCGELTRVKGIGDATVATIGSGCRTE